MGRRRGKTDSGTARGLNALFESILFLNSTPSGGRVSLLRCLSQGLRDVHVTSTKICPLLTTLLLQKDSRVPAVGKPVGKPAYIRGQLDGQSPTLAEEAGNEPESSLSTGDVPCSCNSVV
jgi:hypothetical protein